MPRCAMVLFLCVCAVFAFGAALAGDAGVVTVSRSVEFAEDSGVIPSVQRECQLQTKLPGFIKAYAKKGVELTDKPLEEVEGRVLILEIVGGSGIGGGAWSGPKSVTVSGKLMENGEVIGSFLAARYSGGGAFAGFKGTCSIFGRCVKAIGRDIANWLKNPTMDAALGDA